MWGRGNILQVSEMNSNLPSPCVAVEVMASVTNESANYSDFTDPEPVICCGAAVLKESHTPAATRLLFGLLLFLIASRPRCRRQSWRFFLLFTLVVASF
jgi:hypothetical protein